MGRQKDVFWNYVEVQDNGGLSCKFCKKEFSGGSSRIKSHLSGIKGRDVTTCPEVPKDVQEAALCAIGTPQKRSREETVATASTMLLGLNQSASSDLFRRMDMIEVNEKLIKHLILNNVPLDIIKEPSLLNLLRDVAKLGPRYEPPSYSALVTESLPSFEKEVKRYARTVQKSWGMTGCTLIMDSEGMQSTSPGKCNFVFTAYSPKGMTFLEIPVTHGQLTIQNVRNLVMEILDHESLYISDVIQIIVCDLPVLGEEIVHVNVDSAIHILVEKCPWISKTKCIQCEIQMLLRELCCASEWLSDLVEEANSLYTYASRSHLGESWCKSLRKERLEQHSAGIHANPFSQLQSVVELETEFRTQLKRNGQLDESILETIERNEFWKEGKEVLHALSPLIRIPCLLDSLVPTLGYFYQAIEKAGARIARLAMVSEDCSGDPCAPEQQQTPLAVYTVFVRRDKGSSKASYFDLLVEKFEPPLKKRALLEVKPEPVDQDFDAPNVLQHKKRRVRAGEVANLGILSNGFCSSKGPKLRESCNGRNASGKSSSILKRRKVISAPVDHKEEIDLRVRKWTWLACDGVTPITFVGLRCQVYWPMDDEWYQGSVIAYDAESKRHNIKYEDGEEEDLMLSREKVKFYVSNEEMLQLNLRPRDKSMSGNELDYSELLVLAASLDESQEHEPGDIIWAKLTGHAMWPAVIVDESQVSDRKGMGKNPGGRSVPVQFFGTHDFARIQGKQIVSFLRGLLSSFHLKCKSPRFLRSLREAKIYLNDQKLPKDMLHLQCVSSTDDEDHEDGQTVGSDEPWTGNHASQKALRGQPATPLTLGDLQILNFGEIIRDSVYFQDDKSAWPLGYIAVRKLSSMRDSSLSAFYKMEVLRDPESKIRPLFRVTVDGEQFKGASPSACWNKIFKRMGDMQNDGSSLEGAVKINESGSMMFGFTNPEVLKIIKDMSVAKVSPKTTTDRLLAQRFQNMPTGYRPVRIDWKDLDRCSVCHMDEEYETNLFLQCDKCRIMVHARCYGEECADDVLWFCNLCRPGAPESTPPCCLCPVVGGAMKPTSDGRWAHLSCAIWIPETCLYDIKRMEPIDGINRINRDRWKLLCCICGVSYGACIQCSNSTCRVSYHPLCARAAGLCVELEDEERLHLLPMDEDEEDQCIRLLSFCKKHKPPSNGCPNLDERVEHIASQYSSYTPPLNPSGCARSEPYNYFGRRGRKEPEALAAASVKRLFLENKPYLVAGFCLHESLVHISSGDEVLAGSKFSPDLQKDKNSLPGSQSIHSMAEKYECMRQTFRRRLAFGKSRIHGFGIFTKQPHKAGDMVIEYTGEVVRPSVADRRERLIYNSLVGAGTYMFRIDNERVIDATRAGSIAHLINHSCEPNCYSRVITVNGDEHIIIFSKRDIKQWEELTYDYRFFSIDERLACYCGFPRCRGVVNDVEAEEQLAKLHAPRSELVDCREHSDN